MTSAFQPELWTASSTKSLRILLAGDGKAVTFAPEFTYPIFGDAETVFGYQGLVVNLAFDLCTFKPFLAVKYSGKLNDKVEDVAAKMLEFLPASDVVVLDEALWADACDAERAAFQYPGDRVAEYTHDGSVYYVQQTKLAGSGLTLHKRLQIMVLLFIEAGLYVDVDDDRWELYLLYRSLEGEESPVVCGFATAYLYFCYQGAEVHDQTPVEGLRYRKKISQFVVLPPYQQQGHGGRLYDTIVGEWLKDAQCVEITVEDPLEAFDDLRDRRDMRRLRAQGVLDGTRGLPEPGAVDEEWMDEQQDALKLETRQWHRLVEMALLAQFPEPRHARATRLLIKRRLYDKNRDVLLELDDATRKDKLQTGYERLVEDYRRILGLEPGSKREADEDSGEDPGAKRAKR